MLDTLVDPAFMSAPDGFDFTQGGRAADTAALAGIILDPEQRLALDLMKCQDKNGRYPLEFALVAPRQLGKTVLFQAAALDDLFNDGDRLVIWTAHLFDTSAEAFRDLDALISGSDWLRRRVIRTTRGNGDEGFELRNGSRLKFKARSKTSGRGMSAPKVLLDEAFALTGAELGALLPTLSAQPNPQVRYASSAGMATSDHLRTVRDRGRKGGDPSLAYLEWCAPEGGCATPECEHALDVEGCALDDPAKWQLANFAMGRRITQAHIASERRAMPPAEFARERMGWWDEPTSSADLAYPMNAWLSCEDTRSTWVDEPQVFAIDTNPIRSVSAIALAGRRRDGLAHVEIADMRPGTAWVVERAAELAAKYDATFILSGSGAAASLVPDLEAAEVPIMVASDRELVAACGAFYDALAEQTVRHPGQEQLTSAVAVAKRRDLEGAWALARKKGEISPLVACVLALYRLREEREPSIFTL